MVFATGTQPPLGSSGYKSHINEESQAGSHYDAAASVSQLLGALEDVCLAGRRLVVENLGVAYQMLAWWSR